MINGTYKYQNKSAERVQKSLETKPAYQEYLFE